MSPKPLLVLQLDASDPPARLGEWLTAAGLELHVVALDAGEWLPELADHSGLLVMGGAMGASDDAEAPFLPGVRALLREAVSQQVPTLGVCLGHQLLAAANGGRVRPMPDGPEIGAQLVAKRGVAGLDPLFGTLPITPDVVQWHFDEVTTLPPGAIQLFSSPGCEQQAFRLGRLAWGIQFHIETTPGMVRAWAGNHEHELDDWPLERIVERAVAVHDDLLEVWQPFAEAFAGIVREPDAVAAPRGVPTSTAAPITDPAAIRAALAAELEQSRSAPLPPPQGGPGVQSLPMPQRRRDDD